MKQCTKCQLIKPAEAYNKDSRAKSGLSSACKECIRDWAQKNKDKISEYGSRYRAENADRIAERMKAYYEANREMSRTRDNRWRRENPEKFREYDRNKKARRRGRLTEGFVPDGALAALTAFYGPRCMNPECQAETELFLDHVVPLANGGPHELANLQLLCRACNSAKGNRHEADHRDKSRGIVVGLTENGVVVRLPSDI